MSQSEQSRPTVRHLTTDASEAGQRIDNYLLRILKGVPRSYIYRILRKGEVRVNKGRISASYRLQEGDLIRIPPVRTAIRRPPRPGARLLDRLGQSILYEDARLLVIDKPSGLAVHGGSGLKFGLIEALRAVRPDERFLELVHRLDRDTSGCLLIAKRRSALRMLHEILRGSAMDKRYLALLAGSLPEPRVEVDAPLLKNTLKSGERVVRVDAAGKRAVTRFRVLQQYSGVVLVEAQLLTGRTHQIRVHAAHLGTPILGDEKYGDGGLNREYRKQGLKRLFLHAASLRFRWPETNQQQFVQAPLEQSLEQLLEHLGKT